MDTYADKTTENKSLAAPNNNKANFQLADNRPRSVVQKKEHSAVNNNQPVIQLSKEIALRNWRVVNQYARDQAESAVRAFLRAGYTAVETGRMIVPLINDLGHGEQVFAHGSGGSDSGTQGDTMGRIRACVTDLINWANENPKPESEKKSGGGGKRDDGGDKDKKDKKGKKDKDDGPGGGNTFGTGHLASWITGISAWQSRKT